MSEVTELPKGGILIKITMDSMTIYPEDRIATNHTANL